jgi:hypothetical protein
LARIQLHIKQVKKAKGKHQQEILASQCSTLQLLPVDQIDSQIEPLARIDNQLQLL